MIRLQQANTLILQIADTNHFLHSLAHAHIDSMNSSIWMQGFKHALEISKIFSQYFRMLQFCHRRTYKRSQLIFADIGLQTQHIHCEKAFTHSFRCKLTTIRELKCMKASFGIQVTHDVNERYLIAVSVIKLSPETNFFVHRQLAEMSRS